MKDRLFQAELRQRLQKLDVRDQPLSIGAWVVPGGGKSRLPGIVAAHFPNLKIAWFAPRLTLLKQAARTALSQGIQLRESGNDRNPSRGYHGFVATHAALTQNPLLWRDEIARAPYLVVI